MTIEKRFGKGVVRDAESFASAGRLLKTGVTTGAIVSTWTWTATLLQSSAVAYKYGVAGAFWYAAGAAVQIILFSIIATNLKRKAPNAHTFLELVKVRYGTSAHLTFLFFAFLTNVIVMVMLIAGSAGVLQVITGMQVEVACLFIPLGVIMYVIHGGLRSAMIMETLLTSVIYMIILAFGVAVYSSDSSQIGSPAKMFELLTAASFRSPVDGNAEGSYMTLASREGLIFGIINLIGNFGTVFVDQAYWQRAIAARPSSSGKAFIIAGLCWFSIPFFFATTMGLAARALESDPSFPIYPLTMTQLEVSMGYPAIYAAIALMGKTGAALITIVVFLTCTCSLSAELSSISTIWAYDVNKTYWDPSARGNKLIDAHIGFFICFGVLMGFVSILFVYADLGMGFLYMVMGIMISSSVAPVAFTLTWHKQSAAGAISGAIVGFVGGIVAWVVTAVSMYGTFTKFSCSQDYPLLAGNLASLLLGLTITGIVSLAKPDNFEWGQFNKIKLVNLDRTKLLHPKEFDPKRSKLRVLVSQIVSWVITATVLVIWPAPMYLTNYVFTETFFAGWVTCAAVWHFLAFLVVFVYPIFESRRHCWQILTAIAAWIMSLSCKPLCSHLNKCCCSSSVVVSTTASGKDLQGIVDRKMQTVSTVSSIAEIHLELQRLNRRSEADPTEMAEAPEPSVSNIPPSPSLVGAGTRSPVNMTRAI
jgi:SSS family transporter